MIAPVFL